nr:MAG TPA: hypothetical protein [Caudoviricetes sp.]
MASGEQCNTKAFAGWMQPNGSQEVTDMCINTIRYALFIKLVWWKR